MADNKSINPNTFQARSQPQEAVPLRIFGRSRRAPVAAMMSPNPSGIPKPAGSEPASQARTKPTPTKRHR
jgi:hypothetical protein